MLLLSVLLSFLEPLLISFGLLQDVCLGKQLALDSSVSSFSSAGIGANGRNWSGICMVVGVLGNGMRELRLGAGAAGSFLFAIGQMEALPVLFSRKGCSAMSGLFSFSVGSMYLTNSSIGQKGTWGL